MLSSEPAVSSPKDVHGHQNPDDPGWVVVTPKGEIELSRRDELEELVDREWAPSQNLLIDLSAVTFMDSAGIHWLFATDRRLTEAGREMRVIIPEGGMVEMVLEIVGAKQLFVIYRNLDKALERISSGEGSP